ncbi:MAG TPA: type II secretion system F family protein [Acidimicrobiia bacterium]|nr:type II secretion system F family protein [Acidimicrobiia bacterium]
MTRVAAACCGVIIAGIPGGLIGLAILELLPRLRRRRVPTTSGIEASARLLVLVGAGLPLIAALEAAAPGMPGIDTVIRRSRRLGSAAALGSATGPLAPLLRRLADAVVSGSPPEPAIRSYIEAERRRRHVEAVSRARRLPVRLMVPMTLLVLPGFVLMVYGPAFIDLVTALLGSLTG